jgi:hypothetical protein
MPTCDHCGEHVSYTGQHIKKRVWDHNLECYYELYYCDFDCLYAKIHHWEYE